jgi:hypothetical protein
MIPAGAGLETAELVAVGRNARKHRPGPPHLRATIAATNEFDQLAFPVVIKLAGLPVKKRIVLDLATMLRRADYGHTADTLEGATVTDQADIALTVDDRIAILDLLDDPPDGLTELRATLLQEHVGPKRDGL